MKNKYLTGGLIFALVLTVTGSIFFITSLVPDTPNTDSVSTLPSPDPSNLSSPEDKGDVAGESITATPTKKPIPTPTKAKAAPTLTPTPTIAPTEVPTSTPAPTSEPTQAPTSTPTPTSEATQGGKISY